MNGQRGTPMQQQVGQLEPTSLAGFQQRCIVDCGTTTVATNECFATSDILNIIIRGDTMVFLFINSFFSSFMMIIHGDPFIVSVCCVFLDLGYCHVTSPA